MRGSLIRSVTLLLLVATGCATARPDTEPDARRLLGALDRGDLAGVLAGLKAVAAAHGLDVSDSLRLVPQPFDVPLSSYSPRSETLTMSAMPPSGQGTRYWEQWSKSLTHGSWDIAREVGDEPAAGRLARYTVLTVMAHELGHYFADRYNIWPMNFGLSELLADKFGVAMLGELARVPELAAQLADFRRVVVGSLRAATPDRATIPDGVDLDAWCGAHGPELEILSKYATLQLAREGRLLERQPPLTLAGLATSIYHADVHTPTRPGLRLETAGLVGPPQPSTGDAGFYNLAGQVRRAELCAFRTEVTQCAFAGVDTAGQSWGLLAMYDELSVGVPGLQATWPTSTAFGPGAAGYDWIADAALIAPGVLWVALTREAGRSPILMRVTTSGATPTFELTALGEGPVSALRIAPTPSGAVAVLAKAAAGITLTWFSRAGEREREEPFDEWGREFAADDSGRLYLLQETRVLVRDHGRWSTGAGRERRDWHDGVGEQVAFWRPFTLRGTRDGVLVGDSRPRPDGYDDDLVIRALRVAPE